MSGSSCTNTSFADTQLNDFGFPMHIMLLLR